MNKATSLRILALEERFEREKKAQQRRIGNAKVAAFFALIEELTGRKALSYSLENRNPNPGHEPESRKYPTTGDGPARKRWDAALQDAREWSARRASASAVVSTPDAGGQISAKPEAESIAVIDSQPQAIAEAPATQPSDLATTLQRREDERLAEERKQKILARQEADERRQTREWVARQARLPRPFMGAILGH